MKRQIYLDNAATTKISPEALREYVRVCENLWGNPSSLHSLGNDAEHVIATAKQTILDTLGAKDSEIVFTASGTEANNLAITGRALSKQRYKKGSRIITTHISDHDYVDERHWLPGEGKIDWMRLLAAFEKIGYDGVYNMELHLPRYGEEIMPEFCRFAVTVLRNFLEKTE